MIRGLAGEFGVDTGGPAADTVDVGAEFGEFAGIGVDDPAVRVPGFLPSGDASLVQPLANGAGGHAECGPPRVFRTAKLMLIHAASCRFRYSSWTSCGVL